MKLEKFDLEKAIHGAKVVTRDGREVKQLTNFETRNPDWNLYGVVDNSIYCWDNEGNAFNNYDSNLDLFLSVEPQRIWVNVLKINGQIGLGAIGYTKEEAINNNYHTDKYIKTIEITDEL
jgi:hypothetical protein